MSEVIVEWEQGKKQGRIKITNLFRILKEVVEKTMDPTRILVSVYLNMEQNPRDDGLIWARSCIPSYPAIFTGNEFSKEASKEEILEEAKTILKKEISRLPENKILIERISLSPSSFGKYRYDIECWRMDPEEAFHMHIPREYSFNLGGTDLGRIEWQSRFRNLKIVDSSDDYYDDYYTLKQYTCTCRSRRRVDISPPFEYAEDGINSTRVRRKT